ncbi:uncharacterized protein C2orf81 homolog [Onychostruthus taczanowskii]|uniref:uncharacterized protein C2orf81 homolog n=1 Tax=Onychostruthus taczanowskii TaxID=356909 RepID=UPI001B807BEB|nr:uncharacterized protein C2orf81 homolog [Onychostruthus taczanowskii]
MTQRRAAPGATLGCGPCTGPYWGALGGPAGQRQPRLCLSRAESEAQRLRQQIEAGQVPNAGPGRAAAVQEGSLPRLRADRARRVPGHRAPGAAGRGAHPGRAPGAGPDRERAGGRGSAGERPLADLGRFWGVAGGLSALCPQRVPFAVSRARDAMLFVAEWRFLVRDDEDPDLEGDPDPERDGVWKEDEEPPAHLWDSWTPGVVPVVDVSLPSEEDLPEDLSVAAEIPPVRPGEVPGAAPARGVPASPGQVPSGDVPVAAHAEGPLGQDTALGVPVPPGQPRSAAAAAPPRPRQPRRKPTMAPQPPRRGRQPSRAPERSLRPSRPPPAAPRPPAPPPAAPSEPAAPAAQEPREVTAKVGDQEARPPSSSSLSSVPSIQPRRASRSPGVPRLGARRGATRWVLPEVKVVDASGEPERGRAGASRSWLLLPGSVQVLPGAGRVPRAEPQLCDPWLASVRLAPGVTVRWGGSERRGPALAGHGDDEQGDEALRKAEDDLKPILPYPECRLSEYKESEEEPENALGARQLPGAVPAPEGSSSPRVSPVPGLAPGVAPWDAPGARGSTLALPKRTEVNKKI